MRLEAYIRSLAKSNYWQQLYRASKEINGIHLFENETNLSGLQIIFLYWLKIYDLLYNELGSKEWPNLDEEVIKDDDRASAFLYWRRIEIEKENRQQKKETRKDTRSQKKGMQNYQIFKGKKS